MTAPGGTEGERYLAELEQLEAEGRPDQATAFAALVEAGKLTVAEVLETIEFAERMATALCEGSISDAEVSRLTIELAGKHRTRRVQ